MIANLHTHTPRCNHALGSERQYAEAAIQSGLQILGFSDHTPQWFRSDHYSTMRMRPYELDGYTRSVRALQKEYAGRLDIHLGLEVEYYPGIFQDLLARARDAGIEYMILGQHWNGDEEGYLYNGSNAQDEAGLRQYCRQTIEAMHTGLFTYFAHPDLLHYQTDPKAYEAHMRPLCREAKACRMPLEINLLGLRSGRHYPYLPFWQIAAEEGCQVVLGSDAHTPNDLLHTDSEAMALDIVKKYDLALIEVPQLRRL